MKTRMKKSLFVAMMAVCCVFSVGAYAQSHGSIQWRSNYEQASAESTKTSKPMVIVFTGSDWCGWCKKLEREVFDTTEFSSLAGSSFVFLKVDFPMKTQLPQQQRDHNDQLKRKFGVRGFPTVVILDEKGQKITTTGYQEGGGRKYAQYLLDKVAEYGQYSAKHEQASHLAPDALEELYQQARELGQRDDIDGIVALGMQTEAPVFF